MVKAEPSNTGSLPLASNLTSSLGPLKLLPARVTFVLNLASLRVPMLTLPASRLNRALASSAGKLPDPSNWTSSLAPLKVLPASVTLALSLVSLNVPLLILDAFKLFRLEPFKTGRIPKAVSWTSSLAPLNVLPASVTLLLSLVSLSVPVEILLALV